jgi:hypothetical protein
LAIFSVFGERVKLVARNPPINPGKKPLAKLSKRFEREYFENFVSRRSDIRMINKKIHTIRRLLNNWEIKKRVLGKITNLSPFSLSVRKMCCS